jgi:3-deoxy-7-phosphoheptulonate synthase
MPVPPEALGANADGPTASAGSTGPAHPVATNSVPAHRPNAPGPAVPAASVPVSPPLTLEQLRAIPAAQQPPYSDRVAVDGVVDHLRTLPPLVFAGECDTLTARLGEVAQGRAFILQGGDCAETLAGVRADAIRNTLRTLLSMSVVLTYAGSVPVVKLGRIAGQYTKPRSKPTEIRDGVELPAYRGDAVNGFEFTAQSRVADPERMLRVYNASAATLNLVRAFTHGGEADLRQVHQWNSRFVADNPAGAQYDSVARDIDKAIAFMHACGVEAETFHTVDLYASHEALLLDYEHAMTRVDSRTGVPYGTSGHFLWIGERTRQLDHAHVAWAATVRNPLGVKLGPTTTVEEALGYARALNPDNVPGRLTFVTRMGAGRIREALPPLVQGVTNAGVSVAWVCDPMHGNTFETDTGYKTRRFDDVLNEVDGFFEVHHGLGTWPGGLHVELSGEEVTECVGGGYQLAETDLSTRYETVCDPRLNRGQALELAFLVAKMLGRPHGAAAVRAGSTATVDGQRAAEADALVAP